MKTIYIRNSTLKIFIIFCIILLLDILFLHINGDNIVYSEYELELVKKYNEKKILVLTFDDGPSKYTNEILDILKEENIKATFFVLGENIEKEGADEILLREKNEGHLIGIHSYKHIFFTQISKSEILEQISLTCELIYFITNDIPTYIRVPYGILNDTVEKILDEQNLENVLWTVDSLDWSYKNAQKTLSHVLATTEGNDIILMHDTYSTTVTAVKNIISYYKEKDYVFLTISEFNRVKSITKSLNY